MYLDSSAILSVLLQRPGWEDVARRIDDHRKKLITSAISIVETVQELSGPGATAAAVAEAREIVGGFLKEAAVQEVTISSAQTRAALDAYADDLTKPDRVPLELDQILILGIAKTFRTGVLFTGHRRFPDP